MTVDRYWNNVPLLVPCQTDPFVESRHSYTVTEGPTDVTFDTGIKPGAAWTGSAAFSGATSSATGNNGTQLRITSTDDFTLGSGDFTIECWCTSSGAEPPTDTGADEHIPHTLIERGHNSGGSTGDWLLGLYAFRIQNPPDPDTFQYKFGFYCVDHAAGSIMLTGSDLTTGTLDWVHIAVTRNGNEWTLWRAGMPDDRVISTATITIPSPGADIRIGNSISWKTNLGNALATYGRAWQGNIADVRITKGYCRYGRSFEQAFVDMTEPPGAPIQTSEDTGDYTSVTYQGATGSAGDPAPGIVEDGEPGSGGTGTPLVVPAPLPQYDQQNENAFRRAVMDASRRV